ncbi:unnamed protein product [Albugo candida]|uniref:Uncharacterized protein n=1 Tax=Albugo candida TaxID=65357 RepID=A0A024FV39_9STRA|nr:unnamed protein product [Albugo candida]|eukprot:CCI10916.1 unnamed protein product [Albugo candida]
MRLLCDLVCIRCLLMRSIHYQLHSKLQSSLSCLTLHATHHSFYLILERFKFLLAGFATLSYAFPFACDLLLLQDKEKGSSVSPLNVTIHHNPSLFVSQYIIPNNFNPICERTASFHAESRENC